MKSEKKEHEHVYRRTIDESGEYHACECGYISRTPTIPEDSIHPPQSSNPDPAGRLKELAKKIRSYEESDKTVLDILEDFLDEHAGESAWEDAEKALNAHYLTIAERLIGEPEYRETLDMGLSSWSTDDLKAFGKNELKIELRTAFRKEYGGENE